MFDPRADISLCIINRDDMTNLARLVSRARDFVQEIIVVDTGSADGSMRAAREAGADIVEDASDLLDDGCLRSFSEARQRSYDLATRSWQLWLDTDDDLTHWEQLPMLAVAADSARKELGPGFNVRMWYDYSWNDDRSMCLQSFTRERLSHRDDGWKWQRPLHEYLRRDGFEPFIKVERMRVIHLSQGARGVVGDRNLRILQHWYANGGLDEDPMAVNYYLGDEMLARGRFDEAYVFFDACPKNETHFGNRAIFRGARSLIAAGRVQEAAQYLYAWAQARPNVADFKWELCRALLIGGFHKEALTVYESSRGCEPIEGESPELPIVLAQALGVAA